MKFNKLIPELSVSDFERSLDFYTKTLDFKLQYKRDKFAFLSFQGSQIMIEQANDAWKTGKLQYPFGRGINLQIELKSIKPVVESLKNKNYSLFREPKENWYRKGSQLLGSLEFLIQDPDGYLLRFSQCIGKK